MDFLQRAKSAPVNLVIFLTSPEVSKYFGLFISNWIKENRINSDSNILEVGAGTGSLANQVSKYLEKEIYVSENFVKCPKST